MTRTYLAAQYRRLVRRIGDKRALVAVAHSIVVSIYHMLTRIEKLGYTVTVIPPAAVA